MLSAFDHEWPLYVKALPASSTAAQNCGVGQDTAESPVSARIPGSMDWGAVQVCPSKAVTALPPTAKHQVALADET